MILCEAGISAKTVLRPAYFSSMFILTYLLTPCSTVLLEKLTDFQLVKKFAAFYGT